MQWKSLFELNWKSESISSANQNIVFLWCRVGHGELNSWIRIIYRNSATEQVVIWRKYHILVVCEIREFLLSFDGENRRKWQLYDHRSRLMFGVSDHFLPPWETRRCGLAHYTTISACILTPQNCEGYSYISVGLLLCLFTYVFVTIRETDVWIFMSISGCFEHATRKILEHFGVVLCHHLGYHFNCISYERISRICQTWGTTRWWCLV